MQRRRTALLSWGFRSGRRSTEASVTRPPMRRVWESHGLTMGLRGPGSSPSTSQKPHHQPAEGSYLALWRPGAGGRAVKPRQECSQSLRHLVFFCASRGWLCTGAGVRVPRASDTVQPKWPLAQGRGLLARNQEAWYIRVHRDNSLLLRFLVSHTWTSVLPTALLVGHRVTRWKETLKFVSH